MRNEYVFYAGYTVLMFIVLATAWNILGGYAGYVNFGTPAFFGLGAYTGAVLYKAFALPLGLQIVAAVVMSGLLGLFAGILTLRLRGIFFAIATIALVVIMETLFINWRYAGGATGLQLLRPAPLMRRSQSYITHAVRGDGADGGRRGGDRALHPALVDRPRPARAARQRGRRRVQRRADAQAQAVRLRGVGRR